VGLEFPSAPTFLLHAEDDHVDNVENALPYFIALKGVGVSAELHVYAQGNHVFGLRATRDPITRCAELVETWLHTIGMLNR
jgi:dipeptidyl aminopeptidase/acylaminoacyl peptidase